MLIASLHAVQNLYEEGFAINLKTQIIRFITGAVVLVGLCSICLLSLTLYVKLLPSIDSMSNQLLFSLMLQNCLEKKKRTPYIHS